MKNYAYLRNRSIAVKEISGVDITDLNNVSLSIDVPTLKPSQSYVFARIGVKIDGVEDLIFSPIQKVDIQ